MAYGGNFKVINYSSITNWYTWHSKCLVSGASFLSILFHSLNQCWLQHCEPPILYDSLLQPPCVFALYTRHMFQSASQTLNILHCLLFISQDRIQEKQIKGILPSGRKSRVYKISGTTLNYTTSTQWEVTQFPLLCLVTDLTSFYFFKAES